MCFYCCSSSTCVTTIVPCHHVLSFLVVMCYCSPYFYWYVSLSFSKYLSNLLLLLNSSLLCYYCSPSSSSWFGSFNLVLPITFAFVQMKGKKHEASSLKKFQGELLYFPFVYLFFHFVCMFCMCFTNMYVFGFFCCICLCL